jgi:hypothetical protein
MKRAMTTNDAQRYFRTRRDSAIDGEPSPPLED